MTELDAVLATIDTWGADHAAAAVARSGGRPRDPRRSGIRLPLGVGDQARHRAGGPHRHVTRASSTSTSLPGRRVRPSATCWPTPRGSRSRARRRSRRPGRAGSTRTRASTPSGELVGGARRSSVRGGPPGVRSLRRSGWTRPSSSSGRRRGSTDRWRTSSRSPGNASSRRSSRPRRSRRRRASRSRASSASCRVSAASTRAIGVSASSCTTARRRTGWRRANSPATFGHFGGAGTFLWVDPVVGLAAVVLTDREFGPWALAAWPTFSEAVLRRRRALACPSTDPPEGAHVEIASRIRRLGKGI